MRYLSHVHGRYTNSLFASLGTYISAIPVYAPYRLIIIVKRLYFTDIYPEVFSAISYDLDASALTPATAGAAELIRAFTETPSYQIEGWFRDG